MRQQHVRQKGPLFFVGSHGAGVDQVMRALPCHSARLMRNITLSDRRRPPGKRHILQHPCGIDAQPGKDAPHYVPMRRGHKMKTSGTIVHSICKDDQSRSCSLIIKVSTAVADFSRQRRARVKTDSQSIGLRLCGMVLLPTSPAAKGSSSSAISCFCNSMISLAILPCKAAIIQSR